MSLGRNLREIIGRKQTIITAEVVTVGTGVATVIRPGQSNATKPLPVVSGLSLTEGDVVEVILLNGNINTAYIARIIR